MKLILALALFAVPVPAFAQTPPPGWDIGNSFAKDVCSERDILRSDRACYAAFLRQQAINREEDRAAQAAAYCERQPSVCPLTRRALADGRVTPAEMRRIERRLLQIDCLPENRDHASCGEGRAALCRQEIIGRDEGLIATAPTNWEVDAGISESNPTPACRHQQRRLRR